MLRLGARACGSAPLCCVACGAAVVPGAVGSGLGARPLCVPVGGGPPARRPRREPSARRVGSKPGQALPPPTSTAARPSGPSIPAALAVLLMLGASARSPAVPSGPSGALHTSGACGAAGARRVVSKPGQAPPPTGAAAMPPTPPPPRRWPLLRGLPEWFPSNFARNSPASISNIEFRTLEFQRFRAVSKNDLGKLRATFVWTVTCCSPTRSSTRAR